MAERTLNVDDVLTALLDSKTANFFSDQGGNVFKLGDRLLIGTAAEQDGAAVPAQRTWAGLEASGFLTYYDTRSTVEVISSIGGVSYAGATRVSDTPSGLSNISIVYAALAKNDLRDATAANRKAAYGFYGLAVREPDVATAIAGATQVAEFHVINKGSVIQPNPYRAAGMTSGITNGIIIGCGGEYAEAGETVNSASAAIHISGNNGTSFLVGIDFTKDALFGTDGLTGTADAMHMAKGQQLVWLYSGADDARSFTVRSDCNDINYAMGLVASTTGIRIYDRYENTVARFLPDTTVTDGGGNNSLIFRNFRSTTGNPAIQGTGSDTNVGVDLVGQNRSQFNFYGYSKVRLMARFADAGALTTSTVNYLTINAVDGGATNNPYLKASGTDVNSSVAIEGKGTGGFVARDGAAAIKLQINTTGIGFFEANPVAKQTKPTALSGASTMADVATSFNALVTSMQNYGLLTP